MGMFEEYEIKVAQVHDLQTKLKEAEEKLKLHSVDLELLSTLTIKLKEAEERLKRTDLELRKAKGDIANAKLYYAEALKVVAAVRKMQKEHKEGTHEGTCFCNEIPLPEGGSDG